MSSPAQAIALCRVSTPEQKLNHSLSRQEKNVIETAKLLDVEVIKWWSGDMSSKAGTNVSRPDLKEMQAFCKKHKQVKYLIVDEPDRFMRSIDEGFYFEVLFRELGVKVWYACDPNLNTDDLQAKLLKFSKYFPAEGSNVERITKSINGQTDALKAGRYPFNPKPGYRRGFVSGIPEIDELRGPALKLVLEQLGAGMLTPTQALNTLNRSDFVKDHSLYKMDKFRKIATDSFYAGVVEVDKQVKVRNVNGLHQPLITLAVHERILRIFSNKAKNQAGPLKGGNPKYPCDNIVSCNRCRDKSNGRVVGFDHTNGKPNSKVYERYRCRGCGAYLMRDELHGMVMQQFLSNAITPDGRRVLLQALKAVWKQKEGDKQAEKLRMEQKLKALELAIAQQVEAAIDPTNTSIKDNIMDSIANRKVEASELEYKISNIRDIAAADEDSFMQFALAWVDNISDNFLAPELSKENRLRCKLIVFPAGFWLDKNQKVYTPEISPLITLAATKKDAEASSMVNMVRVQGL